MIATITDVQFNAVMNTKAGKSYTGTKVFYVGEKGNKNNTFVFANAPYNSVVKGLGAGDRVEITMQKKGDFFNVVDIALLEKGDGVAPAASSSPSTGGFNKGGGFSPEKDAMICRQNAGAHATGLITALINADLYKPKSAEAAMAEIIKLASMYSTFSVSGERDLSGLGLDDSEPAKPKRPLKAVKKTVKKKVVNTDVEEDEDDLIYEEDEDNDDSPFD